MSSTLHALTEKVDLVDTDEFYLVQSPYTTGNDRRAALTSLKKYLGKNILPAGTLTASSPAGVSQTWNNAGVTFTGFLIDITSTASAAASNLMEIKLDGLSNFQFLKDGGLHFTKGFGNMFVKAESNNMQIGEGANNFLHVLANAVVNGVMVGSGFPFGWGVGVTMDLILVRDAAHTLAQRFGTNAQITRGYRTFTDAANYERWALQSGAGFFEWAAETAGLGTDNIDLKLTPAGTGLVQYGTHTLTADVPITGFITIKDAGGTTRKLAVIT